MFAIIKTGGKQYPTYVGKVIFIEKIESQVGEQIEFKDEQVLFYSDDNQTTLENPKVIVKAEVLEHKKGEKIIIFKKKRRKNYRRKNGHRQIMSVLRIKEIISQ